MNQYVFFYSMLLANNPECTLTFDQFIDECDEDFTLVTNLQKYITEVFAKQAQLVKAAAHIRVVVRRAFTAQIGQKQRRCGAVGLPAGWRDRGFPADAARPRP